MYSGERTRRDCVTRGPTGIRTPNLLRAKQSLFQLELQALGPVFDEQNPSPETAW